ncbi:translation initiation factor IF-2-like [Felis catus]|uniref:translation initiation factor IF-2-like n=1 Tax=Felis catus TaxID=9685 RepID=UPI001D1A20EA|nr:translation initiation factor IF-2-like [Felis catus]
MFWLQIEPNPASMCNLGPEERVRYQDRKKLGATKERLRQAGGRDPHARRRTPRAPHLSRIRPAAPECGKRGSRRRYKGRAARMSTVRGARGEGAGSRSPGAGRRPASSALTPCRSRGEARAQAPPPAARTSATRTPRPSLGEARRPAAESRRPRGTRRQGCGNACRTAVGPAPGDARGGSGRKQN